MADAKISDLTAIETIDIANDLFEIVDVSEALDADKNKSATPDALFAAFGISNDAGEITIDGADLLLQNAGTTKLEVRSNGVQTNGGLFADSANTRDLGASSRGWKRVYSYQFELVDRSDDPTPSGNGYGCLWQSDGTGSGDDGDLMVSITDSAGNNTTASLAEYVLGSGGISISAGSLTINPSGDVFVRRNSAFKMKAGSGSVEFFDEVEPNTDGGYSLGRISKRWGDLYTTNLQTDSDANLVEVKNSTNAQELRIYSTDDGGGNFERISLGFDTNNAWLTNEHNGGATRDFYINSNKNLRLRGFSGTVNLAIGSNRVSIDSAIYTKPSSSETPGSNGEMVIEATNNTTLTFKLKGTDGTVRSGTVTLS